MIVTYVLDFSIIITLFSLCEGFCSEATQHLYSLFAQFYLAPVTFNTTFQITVMNQQITSTAVIVLTTIVFSTSLQILLSLNGTKNPVEQHQVGHQSITLIYCILTNYDLLYIIYNT